MLLCARTHSHTQHNELVTQCRTPQEHTDKDNPRTTCAKVDILKTMLHRRSHRNHHAFKDTGLKDRGAAQCLNAAVSHLYSQAMYFYQLLKPFPFRHGNNGAQLRETGGIY